MTMETKLLYQPMDQVEADALAVVLFEGAASPPALGFAAGWLDELRSSGEFSGKSGEIAVLHMPAGLKAKRLVAVGGGKRETFDAGVLRRAAGSATRALKQKGVRRLAWCIESSDAAALVEAAVEGAILGNYEPDRHKPTTEAKPLDAFLAVAPANGAELEKSFERGRILAESQNFTRDLVNEPANLLTPMILAQRAKAMAEEMGIQYEVLEQDRMRQLGMGSLLGVAMGSDE